MMIIILLPFLFFNRANNQNSGSGVSLESSELQNRSGDWCPLPLRDTISPPEFLSSRGKFFFPGYYTSQLCGMLE